VDFDALMEGAARVEALVAKAGCDVDLPREGYPFTWYATNGAPATATRRVAVSGPNAAGFLRVVLGRAVDDVAQPTEVTLLGRNRAPLCQATLHKTATGFALDVPAHHAERVIRWLRALSDGYVIFDDAEVGLDIPGPVVVR
jgi:hypothetical protein